MTEIPPQSLFNDPRFRELLHRRTCWSFGLSAYVLLFFTMYVSGMAFAPEFMAIPVWDGAATNIGIVVACFVVVNGFLAAGIYTWWANTRLDRMKKELIEGLAGEGNLQTDAARVQGTTEQ